MVLFIKNMDFLFFLIYICLKIRYTMNGLTNRQFALMMAIEARKIKFQGGIYDNAEDFYNWLEEDKKTKNNDKPEEE